MGSSQDVKLRDGGLFRRARLRADGTLWEFVGFVAEVNFANVQDASNLAGERVQVGSVGQADFYVSFHEVPVAANLLVGHFKAPVGLERYSNSNAWLSTLM